MEMLLFLILVAMIGFFPAVLWVAAGVCVSIIVGSVMAIIDAYND